MDGTTNKAGELTRCIDLDMKYEEKRQVIQFYITNLGQDRIIFGYPWLAEFSPKINWKEGKTEGKLSGQTTWRQPPKEAQISFAQRLASCLKTTLATEWAIKAKKEEEPVLK